MFRSLPSSERSRQACTSSTLVSTPSRKASTASAMVRSLGAWVAVESNIFIAALLIAASVTEGLVLVLFRAWEGGLAVAQAKVEQHFALLVGDHTGIEHRHRQVGRQVGMGLVHGGGAEDDDVRAVFFDGAFGLFQQLGEHHFFLALQQGF